MPTGGSGGSQAAEDYNRDIYIPIRTSRRRFGEVISVRTAGARMNEAARQAAFMTKQIDILPGGANNDEVVELTKRTQGIATSQVSIVKTVGVGLTLAVLVAGPVLWAWRSSASSCGRCTVSTSSRSSSPWAA